MAVSRNYLVVGALLILVGLVLFVAQLLGVDVDRLGWPLLVIVPGLALLFLGVALGDAAGEGLSIAGGITTMVGLVLLYQNATGHWATWAYAWALVAPGGVGVGQVVFGAFHRRNKTVRAGLDVLLVGLTLFCLLGLFFELVIGLSGFDVGGGTVILPAVLIGLGVVLLIRNLFKFQGRAER